MSEVEQDAPNLANNLVLPVLEYCVIQVKQRLLLDRLAFLLLLLSNSMHTVLFSQ